MGVPRLQSFEPSVVAIAYAASITPDCGNSEIINVGTLTNTITINAPTGNKTDGQNLRFRFTQDGTGRAITWNAAFAFGTDITSAMVPVTASAKFEIMFTWHATDAKWRAVSIVRGF